MRLFTYDTLDSTMDEAERLLIKETPPFAVMSRTQTCGKGKPGRKWHDEPGASLLLTLVLPLARPAGEYSFIAGLAVRNTLLTRCGLRCSLKWVNDVYCGGRKLCGILCRQINRNGEACMSIGIGVNVLTRRFPPDLKATSVALEQGTPLPPADLAAPLWEELGALLSLPFEDIVRLWTENMYMRGENARLACGRETVSGILLGIDGQGRLLVRTPEGPLRALDSGTFI
ncbi:MAG: biotin--[Abditibacteriota bacterium]|nr:biotin--[acetyl-CoA-carboxylase] ligase [Abditibacteriota bacterium]